MKNSPKGEIPWDLYFLIFNQADAYNSLKTSVSNGKSSIASAITDKGVSTSATADFSTMASNIRSIPEGTPFEFIEGNCMGDTDINDFTVSYSLGNITAIVRGAYDTFFNNITTMKDIRSNILFFGVNQYTITISSTILTFNRLG